MIAAKALIGISIPLSFFAGTIAERASAPASVAQAARMPSLPLPSPRSDIRVVYPGYGIPSSQPSVAPPPTLAAVEPIRVAALDRDTATAPISVRLDINTATIAELDAAGAGRVGKAITRRRPYNGIEDLVRRRVLTRAAFHQIRERIEVR